MANEEAEKKEVPVKKPFPVKLLIIGLVSLLVVAAGGFFASTFLMSKSAKHEAKTPAEGAEEEAPAHGGEEEEPSGGHGEKDKGKGDGPEGGNIIIPLETFVVNLNEEKVAKYLKIAISLELAKGTSEEKVNAEQHQIRNSMIILLSSKESGDLSTIEGKFKLRDEIILSVNKILGRGKIKNIYFTDFIIQ